MKTPHVAVTGSEVLVDNPYDTLLYCKDCPYEGSVSLPTEFSSTAEIMFIGEAPAEREFHEGRNFVGDSGRLLTRYLREAGHHRRDIHIGNIIRCRVDEKLQGRDKDAVTKSLTPFCGRYSLWEIHNKSPKIVVLMGLPAIHYFVKGNPSVTSIRGKVFFSELAKTYILCTYHPATVMHDWSVEKLIIHDIKKAFDFVEELKDPQGIKVQPPSYVIARNLEESLSICRHLQDRDEIAADVETNTLDWMDPQGEVLSFGFSCEPRTGITIPFTSIHSTPLTESERTRLITEGIKPLMECRNKKIGQNFGFDMHWFLNYGIHVNNIFFDTMLASHLIDENFPYDLDTLADFYTDMGLYANDLHSHLPNKSVSYNVIPDEVLWLYGAKDCDATIRLRHIFDPLLDKEDVRWVFENITIPMISTIVGIERRGVYVNMGGFEKASEVAGVGLSTLREQMVPFTGMGEDFNPNSTKQLQKILFEILKLKPQRKTKTGFSTDDSTLESLEGSHDFISLLQQYRKLAKFKGVYLDGTKEGKEAGLMRQIRPDGRIHTSYKIAGTGTGRLSSGNPNLQNIIRTKEFRALFCAAPGYKFVIADFERGELYVAAHLSNDFRLKKILQNEDVHLKLAMKIYNKKAEDVTKEDRIAAKTIVFGILYGRGPDSIAKQLKISRIEAIKYILTFFQDYPQLEHWITSTHDHVKRYGFVRNLFGRKRHLYGIFSVKNGFIYGEILRQSQNTPIQGTLADSGHLATIKFMQMLKEAPKELNDVNFDAGIVLLVHDEIVVEVREKYVDYVSKKLKEVFEETRNGLKVPVDILVGDDWSIK